MFQKRTLIIVFVVVALGLGFGIFFLSFNRDKNNKEVTASSATNTITTQDDWEAGTKTNVLSTSGQITLNSVATTSIDLVALASADPSIVSASADLSEKIIPVDGTVDPLSSWPASAWEVHSSGGAEEHYWWQIDLGASTQISQLRAFADSLSADFKFQTSADGVSFTDRSDYFSLGTLSNSPNWYEATFSDSARYLRFEMKIIPPGLDPDPYVRLSEFTVSTTGNGTHTTAPTQIDGGANFFEWESFTPTQTTPANTSVTYKYRTSTDASTWTAWVSDIGSVTSRSGEDKYRYLQIEATLSNTDGASTPTIDSYNIGYHTNITPSTPTNLTAVVGE